VKLSRIKKNPFELVFLLLTGASAFVVVALVGGIMAALMMRSSVP
jgi:hypothetical protein